MNSNGEHTREHRSILAAAEKRCLVWIAERLPWWIHSDHLTILGITSMLAAGLAFWASRWDQRALVLVVVALALNWLGDSLDGTLARVRNRQRPRYGFYVDHVVDLFGVVFLLTGLAVSGYMTPLLAVAAMGGMLLLMAESFLATHSAGIFRLSFMRMGPTELRILLGIGTLYLLYSPTATVLGLGPFLLFDIGGVIGTGAMVSTLVVSAARNTRDLYRAEPLPAGEGRRARLISQRTSEGTSECGSQESASA